MLTPEQNATLQAFVQADPTFSILPPGNGSALQIANALNELASPEFIVWRTSVKQDEIMQNGFDWTRVDNLSVGKARIWEWLFDNEANVFDPSKANVRAGIEAVWVGTAADLAVRASVYTHCKRAANGAEKLFATGTGTTVTPAVLSYEGTLHYLDVVFAMGWPY
jgi:hypothetical protein